MKGIWLIHIILFMQWQCNFSWNLNQDKINDKLQMVSPSLINCLQNKFGTHLTVCLIIYQVLLNREYYILTFAKFQTALVLLVYQIWWVPNRCEIWYLIPFPDKIVSTSTLQLYLWQLFSVHLVCFFIHENCQVLHHLGDLVLHVSGVLSFDGCCVQGQLCREAT